jgi:hypothetical protein
MVENAVGLLLQDRIDVEALLDDLDAARRAVGLDGDRSAACAVANDKPC